MIKRIMRFIDNWGRCRSCGRTFTGSGVYCKYCEKENKENE